MNNEEILLKYGLDQESVEKFRKGIVPLPKRDSFALGVRLNSYIRADMKGASIQYIKMGACVNRIIDAKNGVYSVPLVSATQLGYMEIFLNLIKAGADVDQTDIDGNTPLMIAASNNNVEMVKVLIAVGADVRIRNRANKAALEIAEETGNSEVREVIFAEIKRQVSEVEVPKIMVGTLLNTFTSFVIGEAHGAKTISYSKFKEIIKEFCTTTKEDEVVIIDEFVSMLLSSPLFSDGEVIHVDRGMFSRNINLYVSEKFKQNTPKRMTIQKKEEKNE